VVVVRADGDILVLQHRVRAFEDGDDVLRVDDLALGYDVKIDALGRAQLKRCDGTARRHPFKDSRGSAGLALKERLRHPLRENDAR
jgi:hypothetical protein